MIRFTAFFLTVLLIVPSLVMAEDQIVCAAVMPSCNTDGTVQAPSVGWSEDQKNVCAENNRKICLSEYTNKRTDELISCSDSKDSLQAENQKLRRKLRRLRRKLN